MLVRSLYFLLRRSRRSSASVNDVACATTKERDSPSNQIKYLKSGGQIAVPKEKKCQRGEVMAGTSSGYLKPATCEDAADVPFRVCPQFDNAVVIEGADHCGALPKLPARNELEARACFEFQN